MSQVVQNFHKSGKNVTSLVKMSRVVQKLHKLRKNVTSGKNVTDQMNEALEIATLKISKFFYCLK